MKAKKAEPHQYANLGKSQDEDTKGTLQLISFFPVSKCWQSFCHDMLPVNEGLRLHFPIFDKGVPCCVHMMNETFIVQTDQLILGSFMLISCRKTPCIICRILSP